MAEVEQRESTVVDYGNTLSPFFIPAQYPELKFSPMTDLQGGLDFEEPTMKERFDGADIATQRAMLRANNNSDALKIAGRRDVFKESQKVISQDGIMTQIGMGIPTSFLNYSTLLPFGAVYKTAQTAFMVNRIVAMSAAGAFAGGTANLVDEAIFDKQGMPTNYLAAVGSGIILGGGIGMIGASLSGPLKQTIAESLHPKNDTFKDFDRDPSLSIELDANGIPKITDIAPMKKSWLDILPGGKFLRSDVHHVYQEGSTTERSFMSRLVSPTVSMRDSQGNLVPTPKNAVNIKKEADGIHNEMIFNITNTFEDAKKLGYKGDLEAFNKEVWETYSEAMNRQRNIVHRDSEKELTALYDELSLEKEAKVQEINAIGHYYIGNDKKYHPLTEDLVGKIPDERLIQKSILTKEEKEIALKELDVEYRGIHETRKRVVEGKYYDNLEIKFRGDTNIAKAADSYREYFRKMLEKSESLGIKELKGMNKNRIYAPRVYDYKGIKSGKVSQKQALDELRQAISNDARNSKMTGKQIEEAAQSIYTKLQETAFDLNNLSTSYLVKDLPFSTHLKQIKLYLNESYMPSMINNNMSDLTGAYHYKMSGRQGIQHAFGTDDMSEIQKIIRKEYIESGNLDTKGSMEAFERVVKDIAGDLRMNQLADTPAWTWTRNIATANSLRLGGGFGGNQFIELMSSITMLGFKSIMSGRIFKSLDNAGKLLYTKNPDVDNFSKFLIHSGYLENVLHTSRVNRYADTESGFNSGWLENKLNGINDKLHKLNGMRYFTGVMEDYTGGAIMTHLKEGGVAPTTLARWGLTPEQAKNLGTKLREATKNKEFDVSKLTSEEMDSFQLAIQNGIQEIVVQGDSIHLPNWAKAPGPALKLIMQFMRFPLIAQEVLMRKGVTEAKAQMAAGVVGSMVTYMSLKYLREQASIALGFTQPIDAKYDYSKFDNKDWLRVVGEAANYTAPLGMTTGLINYGAIATGNPEVGRDWASKDTLGALSGPTGGGIKDVISLITDIVGTGTVDERTLRKAANFMPGQNLPLVKEAVDEMAKELGR